MTAIIDRSKVQSFRALTHLISLDHQINHRLAVQLIMIVVELDVRVNTGAVVKRVFVVLIEVSHLAKL